MAGSPDDERVRRRVWTPSFTVYEDGHYHCFGCGEHGDVFDWLMRVRGMTFAEAVQYLGTAHRRVGAVAAPRPKPTDTTRNCEIAERIWLEAVDSHGTPVETYLRHRGVWLPDDFRGGRGIVQTGRHVPAWWRA